MEAYETKKSCFAFLSACVKVYYFVQPFQNSRTAVIEIINLRNQNIIIALKRKYTLHNFRWYVFALLQYGMDPI
jgi:hypothetical protein